MVESGRPDQRDMANLLAQPPEVLHCIFSFINAADLASLHGTCRHIKNIVDNDHLLWRSHYLRHWDCPAVALNDPLYSGWQDHVKDNVRLGSTLRSTNDELKFSPAALELVSSRISSLLTESTAHPHKNALWLQSHFGPISPATSTADPSFDLIKSNIDTAFLLRSTLFTNAHYPTTTPASTPILRQLSAKLFVFYGRELEPLSEALLTGAAKPIHPYARSRLYDLRRYTRTNLWGPFMNDGSERVDWEKMQNIFIDLWYNLQLYNARRGSRANIMLSMPGAANPLAAGTTSSSGLLWDSPFTGIAPNSYISQKLSGTMAEDSRPELTAQDPYGVRGTWTRIVCFLDYNDLYAFNFEAPLIPLDVERPPVDTREAFRLIKLQLRVTSIEFDEDDDLKGDDDKSKGKPVVYFEGQSKSTYMAWDPNANSRIRGTVRTTKHGDIRWTTFSIFHGEERWRSEGIQVGGIRSAKGILGNWFDKDFSQHGPCGPTWFWKVSDDIQEEKKRVGMYPPFATMQQYLAAINMNVLGTDSEDEDDDDSDNSDDDDTPGSNSGDTNSDEPSDSGTESRHNAEGEREDTSE